MNKKIIIWIITVGTFWGCNKGTALPSPSGGDTKDTILTLKRKGNDSLKVNELPYQLIGEYTTHIPKDADGLVIRQISILVSDTGLVLQNIQVVFTGPTPFTTEIFQPSQVATLNKQFDPGDYGIAVYADVVRGKNASVSLQETYSYLSTSGLSTGYVTGQPLSFDQSTVETVSTLTATVTLPAAPTKILSTQHVVVFSIELVSDGTVTVETLRFRNSGIGTVAITLLNPAGTTIGTGLLTDTLSIPVIVPVGKTATIITVQVMFSLEQQVEVWQGIVLEGIQYVDDHSDIQTISEETYSSNFSVYKVLPAITFSALTPKLYKDSLLSVYTFSIQGGLVKQWSYKTIISDLHEQSDIRIDSLLVFVNGINVTNEYYITDQNGSIITAITKDVTTVYIAKKGGDELQCSSVKTIVLKGILRNPGPDGEDAIQLQLLMDTVHSDEHYLANGYGYATTLAIGQLMAGTPHHFIWSDGRAIGHNAITNISSADWMNSSAVLVNPLSQTFSLY